MSEPGNPSPATDEPTIEAIEVQVIQRQVRVTHAPQRAAISLQLLAESDLKLRGDWIYIGEPVENEHIYEVVGLTDDRRALIVDLIERPLPAMHSVSPSPPRRGSVADLW